jgi:hypothetical protein
MLGTGNSQTVELFGVARLSGSLIIPPEALYRLGFAQAVPHRLCRNREAHPGWRYRQHGGEFSACPYGITERREKYYIVDQ